MIVGVGVGGRKEVLCRERKRLTDYGRERRALVSDTRGARKRRKELMTGKKIDDVWM